MAPFFIGDTMQHSQIKTKRHGQTGVTYELPIDAENMLILRIKKGESPSLIIGFKLSGVWYYQFLLWSCRGGKAFWFKPMITMYRFIRRNKITDHSLRFIACGEHKLKNAGYAIRSESYRSYQEISRKMEASTNRENRIMECLLSEIEKMPMGPHWSIEKLSRYGFVINQRTSIAHVPTSAIFFRAMMGSVFVQRFTGMTRSANESDPFRKMVNRKEHTAFRFHDSELTPEELVGQSIATIKQMMEEQVPGGYPTDLMAA